MANTGEVVGILMVGDLSAAADFMPCAAQVSVRRGKRRSLDSGEGDSAESGRYGVAAWQPLQDDGFAWTDKPGVDAQAKAMVRVPSSGIL